MDPEKRMHAFFDRKPMELDEIRNKIGAIDAALIRLFSERMSLADAVADTKRTSGGKVYVPEREQAIYEKYGEEGPETVALLKRVIAESRLRQYRFLIREGARDTALLEVLRGRIDACIREKGQLGLSFAAPALSDLMNVLSASPVQTTCLHAADGRVSLVIRPDSKTREDALTLWYLLHTEYETVKTEEGI